MSCNCGGGSSAGQVLLIGENGVTVSGSGTPTDPYRASGSGSAPVLQLQVRDSSTVNLSLFGSGTVADPYVLRGDTSSAVSLRGLGDVAGTPTVKQGAVPLWIGDAVSGRFELRLPGTRYTTNATRGSGLYQGEVIKEQDTGKRYEWDGSQWVDLSPNIAQPTLDPSVLLAAGTLATSTDWNTLNTRSGIYRVNGWDSGKNTPPNAYNYGTLEVVISGLSVTHRYSAHSTNRVYVRTKYNASDWTDWGLLAQQSGLDSTNSSLTSALGRLSTLETTGATTNNRITNLENSNGTGSYTYTNGGGNPSSGAATRIVKNGRTATIHFRLKCNSGFGINGIGTILTNISPAPLADTDCFLRISDNSGGTWASVQSNGNFDWRPGAQTVGPSHELYGSVTYDYA